MVIALLSVPTQTFSNDFPPSLPSGHLLPRPRDRGLDDKATSLFHSLPAQCVMQNSSSVKRLRTHRPLGERPKTHSPEALTGTPCLPGSHYPIFSYQHPNFPLGNYSISTLICGLGRAHPSSLTPVVACDPRAGPQPQ